MEIEPANLDIVYGGLLKFQYFNLLLSGVMRFPILWTSKGTQVCAFL
jgi:hypothetical protein